MTQGQPIQRATEPLPAATEQMPQAILYEFAQLLQQWSVRVQSELTQAPPTQLYSDLNENRSIVAEDEGAVAPEGTATATATPPAHWLAQVQRAGAPAHWLADIQRAQTEAQANPTAQFKHAQDHPTAQFEHVQTTNLVDASVSEPNELSALSKPQNEAPLVANAGQTERPEHARQGAWSVPAVAADTEPPQAIVLMHQWITALQQETEKLLTAHQEPHGRPLGTQHNQAERTDDSTCVDNTRTKQSESAITLRQGKTSEHATVSPSHQLAPSRSEVQAQELSTLRAAEPDNIEQGSYEPDNPLHMTTTQQLPPSTHLRTEQSTSTPEKTTKIATIETTKSKLGTREETTVAAQQTPVQLRINPVSSRTGLYVASTQSTPAKEPQTQFTKSKQHSGPNGATPVQEEEQLRSTLWPPLPQSTNSAPSTAAVNRTTETATATIPSQQWPALPPLSPTLDERKGQQEMLDAQGKWEQNFQPNLPAMPATARPNLPAVSASTQPETVEGRRESPWPPLLGARNTAHATWQQNTRQQERRQRLDQEQRGRQWNE